MQGLFCLLVGQDEGKRIVMREPIFHLPRRASGSFLPPKRIGAPGGRPTEVGTLALPSCLVRQPAETSPNGCAFFPLGSLLTDKKGFRKLAKFFFLGRGWFLEQRRTIKARHVQSTLRLLHVSHASPSLPRFRENQ